MNEYSVNLLGYRSVPSPTSDPTIAACSQDFPNRPEQLFVRSKVNFVGE